VQFLGKSGAVELTMSVRGRTEVNSMSAIGVRITSSMMTSSAFCSPLTMARRLCRP
jgi:hypothetical protein